MLLAAAVWAVKGQKGLWEALETVAGPQPAAKVRRRRQSSE